MFAKELERMLSGDGGESLELGQELGTASA